ncbi:hypothetical protein [Streptosporangium lutulentum]|uniref:Uncharacterized protein n=1 Tax=Streptosporangium lutulentum TaxID=1461250 RepID=A0ABT9QET6_9ACTN|nr:hypothetical protein [Streptosporangium lutulentum]MDP9844833.1 hypothetical protein [Streptosporangium lutulentum]
MADIAERVERLCALLGDDDLWDYAEESGSGRTLRDIVAAVGDGDDGSLQHHLDALDEAMARLGLGAITQPERTYQPLAGTGGGHPVVQAWACPAPKPCSRVETEARQGPPPVCAATGHSLVLVRVAT